MKPPLSLLALSLAWATWAAPTAAHAFCGFYVSGADAALYNHATQVVLMREGTRTVLSMQNNYEGPPVDFAMVVPVPVVLQKENVKTLSRELFDKVDRLDAPRLVEYWEQDPCARDEGYGYEFSDDPLAAGGFGPNDATIRVRPAPVRVLNRFAVGEYEVVILGADDSLSLDRWLREHRYRIPEGAEPVLRPYVQAGMKFFVARVDPRKVRFANGMATLSPLRFHYDSDAFQLPVRLGLLNSAGKQDLIVHILARGQRYEVANRDNVVVPTNLDVAASARAQFGAFYAALFDYTLAARPGAVVTEYAWDASSCDPCPTPPLDPGDLAALGVEALPEPGASVSGDFVLTRLHARYDRDALRDDLVFRAAPPISGGREERDEANALERGFHPDGINNFQARYVIRHPWTGSVTCAAPRRGVWGARTEGAEAAQNLAFAPRASVDLGAFLGTQPTIGVVSRADPGSIPGPIAAGPARGGCAACVVGADPAGGLAASAAAFAAGLGALRHRRRRAPPRRTVRSLPSRLPCGARQRCCSGCPGRTRSRNRALLR